MGVVRRCLTLVLLAGLGACATPAVPGSDAVGRSDPSLTVATLNLYHDRDPWPPRAPLVLAGLHALDADVIALQEVIQRPGLPNQAEELGQALGYQVHFVSVDPPGSATRYGNAVLSRLPILARGSHRLEPLADSRTVARVRVDLRGTPVQVYATHLHAGRDGGPTRRRQVGHLLDLVQATAGSDAVVLAGDFNAEVESPELAPLLGRFLDAYGRAHPGSGTNPLAHVTLNPAYFEMPTRIDHVYVQRGRVEVDSARRFLDAPGPGGIWPSDHFGIAARLRLHAGTSTP